MDPDLLFLRTYHRNRDEQAFERLVRRYVDLVYAAAMRQVHDRNQAEEITQAVFVLLSQKAGQLSDHVLLGGWLINSTRLVSKSFLRAQRRRIRHEQQAAGMKLEAQTTESDRRQITELIDDALAKLDAISRGVLVMQFMEGRSGKELADVLGISEEAARKRISRALSKLRKIFVAQGIVVAPEVLGATLTGMRIAAPPGLSSLSATAAKGSPSAIVKGAGILLALKANAAAVGLVATVLIAAGVSVGVSAARNPAIHPVLAAAPQAPAVVSGSVVDPDGKPAEGAQILIGTVDAQAPVYWKRKNIDAVTDKDGKFSLTPPPVKYGVAIKSANGFAEMTAAEFEAGAPIHLSAWGRIEGTLENPPARGAKTTINIWRISTGPDPLRQLVTHQTSVQADAKGRFVFDKVAPGELWVSIMNFGHGHQPHEWLYVQIEAGKTETVSLSDIPKPAPNGHAIEGKIETPGDFADRVDWLEKQPLSYSARLILKSDKPNHANGETEAQYKAVEEVFGKAPEGKLAKEWVFGRDFAIQPDGSFHVEGLPAGKFELEVRNFEDQQAVNFMEDVAGLNQEFQIPEKPASEPIDLGTFTLTPKNLIHPGSMAPNFTAKTRDGKEWKLADQKGKVVLLIMWGPTPHWTDEMKTFGEVWKQWQSDPRVAVLGIYNADSEASAQSTIDKYGLGFPQTPTDELMTRYENSWPSAVVIGRDGKIIQKHLNKEVLKQTLKKAVEAN